MTEFSLDGLIQDVLRRWKEPDPHVIARRLFSRVPVEGRDRLALAGLVECVGLAIRSERSSTGIEAGTRRVGVSRWQRFSQREYVRGEWKLLADCTVDEVDWLAEDRAVQGAKLLAVADQFRVLAARMRAVGAVTVAELPDDDVVVEAA